MKIKNNYCKDGGHWMMSDGSCLCGHFQPFKTEPQPEASHKECNKVYLEKSPMHTPTPWRTFAQEKHIEINFGVTGIANVVRGYPYDHSEANAEFIVRSVNSFESNQATIKEQSATIKALLEAAKESLFLFKHFGKKTEDFLAMELCEKAIAQAEKSQAEDK